MVAASPVLMHQSPSDNEKTFIFWGLFPHTPTGALPLDPELNVAKGLLSYVYHWSTMQCIICSMGRRLV